ncbi:gamma-glutamyltranspeptidase [Rhizoclosmatium globosum]|uniref:Gamma-glutamyltranspeptidase n=1 Tax=Rhizoclosmatium globosum TaxID=329046 RepID=A0A1Y2CNV3_9FUNG|nr:gamma-glutamyltranspeptidase [Rhizoclosmatium globosum]|eukprot:ORY48711.1 gamma-glutamyltranspeptidase [Rhizoclosmatium globosum]
MVSSSQPLASLIGRKILDQGGNAADAAVAVAAALAVTEPCSTGIGGDAFCLFYDAKSKTVKALNASGRCPEALTIEKLRSLGFEGDSVPNTSAHSVTVPGAAAGWVDTVDLFGSKRLSLAQILEPATELAERGFPVSELTAQFWKRGEQRIMNASPNGHEMLRHGKAAPAAGEIMKLPNMGKTFRALAEQGKAGFYEGRIAESIVKTLGDLGSTMTLDDLKNHSSTPVEPISIVYNDQLRVHECPPNGQGITALIALGILDSLQSKGKRAFLDAGVNSVSYLHTVIEALRLAFADSKFFVTDPEKVHVPVNELLSKEYLAKRAELIDPQNTKAVAHGSPANSSDTVYFSVVDKEGNACSFINSNYEGFGSAIVPEGCGFVLQNRGSNFNLDPNHPNALAPLKRPYHTIIPAMVTRMDGSLHISYGVMGGFMQPQGHVQVLLNMHHFGMTPQEALDTPRICIMPEEEGRSVVLVEEGIRPGVVEGLKALGHEIQVVTGLMRANFGRGQIIVRREDEESAGGHVLVAGCDPRCDGIAVAQF